MLKEPLPELIGKVEILAQTKLERITALVYCDRFVEAATDEAAYGSGLAFFGKMREAGDRLPSSFESLDPDSPVKGVDKRVQPYIRAQLFVALITELEDYLHGLLTFVIRAYPEKIGAEKIEIRKLILAESMDVAIGGAIDFYLSNLTYKKPADYRLKVEELLSLDNRYLDPLWPAFVEMKARRDLGVHGNWIANDTYRRKVLEVGGNLSDQTFLAPTASYFQVSAGKAGQLVAHLREGVVAKFA